MTNSETTAGGPRGRVLGMVAACAGVAALVAWWAAGGPRVPGKRAAPAARASDAGAEAGTRLLGRVPTAFVPNLGQWDHPARFVARFGAMTVLLEDRGFWVDVAKRMSPPRHHRHMPLERETDPTPSRGTALRFTFEGAAAATLEGEVRLAGVHNYFLGNDPARWRTEVPRFGAVAMRGLYPGVDVRGYERDGHFEYDLVLAPGADLASIEVWVEGAEAMRVDGDGALVIETAVGPVRQPRPVAFVVDGSGERVEVACAHELRGSDRFGFVAAGWSGEGELVVDPGLVWSTFVGGWIYDSVSALAIDAQGAATVAGQTHSTDFPTTPGALDTSHNGYSDAFVTRLSPTGSSLVYSTFLGGTGGDWAQALAIDAQGAATFAGFTSSTDFPTTPGAFDTSYSGGFSDAFVASLSATGTRLAYSTFLGGTGEDRALALALDAHGAATVAGLAQSTDFPTTPGAFDTSFNGGGLLSSDAFVTRLSPTGTSLVYSTFLGGTGDDYFSALALDVQGAATVAGTTGSADFPTTSGGFDTSHNGGYDVFVTCLSPTGSNLVYSTFVGGTGGDWAQALALDPQGVATFAGYTQSSDFPTTPGAFDTSFNDGVYDAFVTRLSPTGSSLVYSTYLGGTGGDGAFALALDAQGAATVAGFTASTDFPTTPGTFDTSYNGGRRDAFVTRLSPTGTSLVYSTFTGGAGEDSADALGLDAQGGATLAGYTYSTDYPTTPGSFDTSFNGGGGQHDAFLTRLDLLPTGARTFGTSSPGCTGSLAIGVTSMSSIGNATFTITCGNAPRGAAGVLLVAPRGLATPIRVLGVDVWVDPAGPWFLAPPTTSNGMSAAYFPMPIPQNPDLVGQQLCAQFGWAGPSSPPPCPPAGFSASNAIEITIQP